MRIADQELVSLGFAPDHRLIVQHEALPAFLLLKEGCAAEARDAATHDDQIVSLTGVDRQRSRASEFAVAQGVSRLDRRPHVPV